MAETPLLRIEDLHVSSVGADPRPILDGISLTVGEGELHAVMGPARSGKSSLAATLLGSPGYEVTSGRILFRGDDITDWATDVRSKVGIFLAFERPHEISGVSVQSFLRQSLAARNGTETSMGEFRTSLALWLRRLGMDQSLMDRHVNVGFSAAERKYSEILQMAILEPELAILDETGSLLDADALDIVAAGVGEIRKARPALGTLAITQHRPVLESLRPDHVHVLLQGRIVASGGFEIAEQLDHQGYESFR